MLLSPNMLDDATRQMYEDVYVSQRDYFIDSDSYDNAGFFKWIVSKGTSIDCFVLYLNQTDTRINKINNTLDILRTIFYAMLKPVQSQFFYWTMLLFIIHKFNFRKPIMKLLLYHYVFRTIGDIIEGLGDLLNHYYSIGKEGECVIDVSYTEQHPLRWALTRQFNSFFWYIGEIIGDWYPLLRTKAVAREKESIVCIYCTCIMYNVSKLAVPISQLFLNPTKLYTKDGVYNKDYVDEYYNYYSCILVVIIATSLIYDATVYLVLKREVFNKKTSEYGFMKKFRRVSEYRIVVSAIIGVIGLPFTLITAVAKVVLYYRAEMKDLNFSIEEFRLVVNNVQYMIIFIDQILLINSRIGSSVETYENEKKKKNNSSSNYYNSDATSSNYYHSTFNTLSNFNSTNYAPTNYNPSNQNFSSSNINFNNFNNTIRNIKLISSSYYSSTNDSKKSLCNSENNLENENSEDNNVDETTSRTGKNDPFQYEANGKINCNVEYYKEKNPNYHLRNNYNNNNEDNNNDN